MSSTQPTGSGHDAKSSLGVGNGFLGASSAVATEEIVGTALGGPLVVIAAAAVVYTLDNIEHVIADFISPAPPPLSDCLIVQNPLTYVVDYFAPIHGTDIESSPLAERDIQAPGFDEAFVKSDAVEPVYDHLASPIHDALSQLSLHSGLIVDPADWPVIEGKDFIS